MQMRSALLAVAGVAVVAALGLGGWRWIASRTAEADTAPPPPPGIPVEAAAVTRGDVPVYLTGLGGVQAFNTVTIKARVDGALQQVFYAEGQSVKVGDLLARIDPRPFQAQLDQATAKRAQDEAQLANAKLDLARFTGLLAQDYAPRQSVDTQRALVAQLTATVKADEAAIEAAQVQLDYTTITSPIAGRTGVRLVDQGNIVHASDTGGLVVITQMQPISVLFTLPQEDLPPVTKAMAAGTLPVVAYASDGKTKLAEGSLAVVDNTIDTTTGTARLKATFPNQDNALWPGQFVNVRVQLQTQRGVVTIPAVAVQRGPQGLYAYVVGRDSKVELRPLEVGQISGGTAVIEKGLAAGERVVIAGASRIEPGSRVEVRAAAAAAPIAAVQP
jgi:membrane fusion protein, multidrug efflux system